MLGSDKNKILDHPNAATSSQKLCCLMLGFRQRIVTQKGWKKKIRMENSFEVVRMVSTVEFMDHKLVMLGF